MPLRYRHGYAAGNSPWPPDPGFIDPAWSSPPVMKGECAPPTSPHPPGWSWRLLKRRNATGSSRIPSRLAHHARHIRQSRADVTLSRLLPPSPATPGSGCLQLHPAAATARRWTVSHLHPEQQRLVAHTNRRHMTGDHHGRTARRATLLVTAVDEILGTHSSTTVPVGSTNRESKGSSSASMDARPRRASTAAIVVFPAPEPPVINTALIGDYRRPALRAAQTSL
jgi:hypothetical protein